MIIASLYHCPLDYAQIAHDMSCAIITKNKIYAYEEEKLTSLKNESTVKFPEKSLLSGLKELNIKPEEVTDWVFPEPSKKIEINDFKLFFCDLLKATKYNSKKSFKKWFKKKVHFIPHHLSHASLAFYTSKFKSAAFLTKDGGGDLGDPRGFVFGEFNKNKMTIKRQSYSFKNLSLFHDYLTDALGFSYFSNGKTSGLAAYGKIRDELKKKFSSLLEVKNNGISFKCKRFKVSDVNIKKFKNHSYERYKVLRSYPSDTNIFRLSKDYLPIDIAATGEEVLKEKLLELLKKLRKITKKQNLVCSGGLFQNVSLNNLIVKSKIFKNCFFPMANSDAGLSLGAALYIKYSIKKMQRRLFDFSPYLGPSFSSTDIKLELDSYRLNYRNFNTGLEKYVAHKILKGYVVGWFQGRGEYGPRSLGNRSILADPRSYNSKIRVNQLLKKRDWFMPFAPSINYEYAKKIINLKFYSAYMQIAFNINKKFHKQIKSSIHHDNTSRIHMVKREQNYRYWKLLNEIKKKIGVPVVLNTSFNRHGIATISTPRQAIEHAMEGCMDLLVIDNYVIEVKKNRKFNKKKQKTFSEKESLIKSLEKRFERLKSKKIKFNQKRYQNFMKEFY
jgi:carbamoyltransferase